MNDDNQPPAGNQSARRMKIRRRRFLRTAAAAALTLSGASARSLADNRKSAQRSRKNFDVIVVGLGAIGSASLYWLSRRLGSNVLGIEQFPLGHSNGSGQDHSRSISYAYEQTSLARLAVSAFETWREVEADQHSSILQETGGLVFGEVDGIYNDSMDRLAGKLGELGLPYELWDSTEAMRRYPQFRFRDNIRSIFLPEDALVDANKGNAAHICGAVRNGARMMAETPVVDIRIVDGGIAVETDDDVFECQHLVLTAGAWSPGFLKKLGFELELSIYEVQQTYFVPDDLDRFAIGRFPRFSYKSPNILHGFPVYGEAAVKAGLSDKNLNRKIEIGERTFAVNQEAERRLNEWLDQWIPGFAKSVFYTKPCIVTRPPDSRCIADSLPDCPQISFAVGAGMAYKFASLFGKVFSQIAIDGRTDYDISSVSFSRSGLSNKQAMQNGDI
ncbi:MAG TPA: FAD-dependent oxidoreductase [Woeseiaceae bacterium]|nr:FAD-dependent oxidoreductase [Woeseiaceae bacterium]